MADLRRRLWDLSDGGARPALAYFLHDEVLVHTPVSLADQVVAAVRDAVAEAGRLLFGHYSVEFAISVAVVFSYAAAKE